MKTVLLTLLAATSLHTHSVTGTPNDLDNAFDVVQVTSATPHWKADFSYTCDPDQKPWFAGQVHLALHREGTKRYTYSDLYDQSSGRLTLTRPRAGAFTLRVQTGCTWKLTSSATLKELG